MGAGTVPVAPELALDLGTASTRLVSRDGGIVVESRSVVRSAARKVESPLAQGVIIDVDGAARMLSPWIRAGRGASPFRPRVLVSHPSDASREERGRLVAAVLAAGAGAVALTAEPVAAAAGARDGAAAQRARLVVDLGEGTTDVAIVRGDRLVASGALRWGLMDIRYRLQREVQAEHGVALRPAELIWLLGQRLSAGPWLLLERNPRRRERGATGARRVLRRMILVRSDLVAKTMEESLDMVAGSALRLLRSLDRNERAGVATDGILLTGGGSLLPHVREGIGARLGISLCLAPDPLHAVVDGTRRLLRLDPDAEWLTSVPAAQGLAAVS